MQKFYKSLPIMLSLAFVFFGGGESTAQTAILNSAITYTSSSNTYKCAVNQNGSAPQLWSQAGWNNVITMYFGGWKYQDASAKGTSPEKKDDNITNALKSALAGAYPKTSNEYYNNSIDEETGKPNTKKSDYWDGTTTDNDYVNTAGSNFDYFQYYFKGYRYLSWGKADNARSEFLEDGQPGKYVFQLDKRNEFRKGNPFTVPCFGTFLKFEPAQNGTVTLYIIQNGIIDLSASSSGGSGLQSKATWRPLYIVDELGNLLTDEGDDGVKVQLPDVRQYEIQDQDNGQKIYIGWDGTYNSNTVSNTNHLPNNADDNNVDAFTTAVSGDFKKGLTDEQWQWLTGQDKDGNSVTLPDGETNYWTTGGSVMRMMPPKHSGDGWVAINKTYAKYTFNVKAGKSYYIFMNSSKLGFCGYEFTSTGAPTGPLTIGDDTPASDLTPGTYNITLKRQFKPGWNAICLPFSVTESKMRKWFGTGSDGNGGHQETYELVTYNGAAKVADGETDTKDGLVAHFFRHAYQDIIAGYPYMLYIPSGAEALTATNGITFENVTIEDDVEMATFSSSNDYMDSKSSKYDIAKEDDYRFEGTFSKRQIPAGSYVVYGQGSNLEDTESTGIRYLASASEIGGMRSYLCPKAFNGGNAQEVKDVARIAGTNFSEVLDDAIWDNATVINDILAEAGFLEKKENVYSLTGQLVRQNSASLVGLPKGIYIVNGKKYFVK